MKYCVNEYGVKALRELANAIRGAVPEIVQECDSLHDVAETNCKALGPHKSSLISALKDIYLCVKEAATPANEIADIIIEVADGYEEIIGNDRLKFSTEQATTFAGTLGTAQSGAIPGDVESGTVSSESQTNISSERDAVEYGASWGQSLSADELSAVRSYTGSTYDNVNGALRGMNEFYYGNLELARTLHGSLQRCSLPAACTLYRGTAETALADYQNLPDSALEGKIISDKAFMSTSFDVNTALHFEKDMLIVINAPKGAKGVYVGSVGQYGHHEKEVLFDINQKMRINKVGRDGNGNRILYVNILV